VPASFCEVCSAVNAGAAPIGESHCAVVVFFTQDAYGFLGQKI